MPDLGLSVGNWGVRLCQRGTARAMCEECEEMPLGCRSASGHGCMSVPTEQREVSAVVLLYRCVPVA